MGTQILVSSFPLAATRGLTQIFEMYIECSPLLGRLVGFPLILNKNIKDNVFSSCKKNVEIGFKIL